jgi:hypothetical protein
MARGYKEGLTASYFIPITALLTIIGLLFYYNTFYLPDQQAQGGLTQIKIPSETPPNLTYIPGYCLAPSDCVYHWHVHLDILVNQSSYVVVPSSLGHINGSQNDLYAIHTHDYSGIVHIECCRPHENLTFSLGELFQVWGYPKFDSTYCLTFHGQPVTVYVNGQKWPSTSVAQVPLLQHEEIAVVIGTDPPPSTSIPSSYSFPQGF